jgi:hypothetical protein
MSNKKDEQQGSYFNSPKAKEATAHNVANIKYFLQPYFLFRAYIVFKANNGDKKYAKKFHAYGNEHSVTYNQLRYGRYDNIKLDRMKGYTDLIKLIERNYHHHYTRAQIYMRLPGEKDFNTLCRDYNEKSELLECQDPVLTPEQEFLTLYYYTHAGLVIVTETDPAGENLKTNL